MKFGFTRREIKPVTKEQEEEFSKSFEENKVGAKDKFAMILAAFLTIVLPCLAVLGLMALVMMLIFGGVG